MASWTAWRRQALLQLSAVLTIAALVTGCSVAVDVSPPQTAAPVPIRTPSAEVDRTEPTATASQTRDTETAAPEEAVETVEAEETAAAEPEQPPQPAFNFPVSDEWPESIREYVDFVQETRGEAFASVADVRFADPVVIVAEFQFGLFSFDDLDPEDQAIVLRLDDMYRALGLANDEFNILEANSSAANNVAAFYDWQVGEIVFPSEGGEYLDEIPLRDQPVLVHELGHALQAEDRIRWANRMEDFALSTAMLEGEAEWLLDRYVQEFTESEWQEWYDSFPPAEPSGLPEIVEVEFSQPYFLGGRFFHAQYAVSGLQGINDVFGSRFGAVSAQMLLDPWLFDGATADQETFNYDLPETLGPGTLVDIAGDFPTSAVNWHQILGAALPADQALEAARGINSYSFPTGWIDPDDRLCFSLEASASSGHQDQVEAALRAWTDVDGVDRWFEITNRGFYVGGCDPGPGNVPTPRATPGEILAEVTYVLDMETWALDQGIDRRAGFCAAWDFVALVDGVDDEEVADLYFDWFEDLDAQTLPTDC